MTAATALGTVYMAGIDFGRDDVSDLHARLAELRSKAPYAVVNFHGGPAIMFLGNALLSAAFKDEAAFPAPAIYVPNTRPVLGRTIQCMTGQEHRMNRALVSPAFRRKLMVTYSVELLEPLAHELVDTFAHEGSADLVAQFTEQYPFLVTTRLLGLPTASDPEFQRWAHDLFNFPHDPENAMRASVAFTRYLEPLVAQKRERPTDDLLSTLATTEFDGQRLTDEEIYSFVRLLFPAGVDTTYLSIGNALYALLTHTDQLDRVRNDPNEITWAVEESLRWEPPVALLPRFAPKALYWRGISIPDNTRLVFAISAANRDSEVYPDPDRFDIGRRKSAPLAFGSGPHTCLGMFLAQAQIGTAVRVILDRLPGIRLAEPERTHIGSRLGTALRGPAQLRVSFGG